MITAKEQVRINCIRIVIVVRFCFCLYKLQKICKMQKGFFGAVRIAHTGCMDDICELINAAK
jgi:hypothetical protein